MTAKPVVQVRPCMSNAQIIIEDKTPPLSAKKQVLRNLVVLSLSFLLLFTAYQSLQNLQSSINAEGGLGTASLAAVYLALVISCMFVPSYMIRRLGLKYTMVTSICMYLVYFFANMKPTWITLIPASFILGTGGAPLWTAKCSYLTAQAQEYADIVGALDSAPFVTGFFGIFFMLFQSAQIWGNLTSYLILRPPHALSITASDSMQCGSSFHPMHDLKINNTNLGSVTPYQVLTLSGLYACLVIASIILMVLFLDPLANEVQDASPPKQLIIESLRQMRNGYQQLMIPLTIYSGLQQAFLWGDYTQAFISCSWGVQYVGFVMMSYGVMDSICSMVFGLLVRRVGRIPLVLMAAVLNLSMMVLMLVWKPTPEQAFYYFIIAIIWGVADASWQTQINAFYSIIFVDSRNAAFANYRLWESTGFIIMFALQSVLRFYVKVIGLMLSLLVGIVGYLVIEFHKSAARTPNFAM
ncbi:protein unc-93 homolog A-like [Ornithodoros turicata]|uniref:protein unc-93 homolog A-like n=1 Tax=Ornithodoros turicata TaxID=34597 RepID=UPI00313A20BC